MRWNFEPFLTRVSVGEGDSMWDVGWLEDDAGGYDGSEDEGTIAGR